MKLFSLFVLMVAYALPLRADEALQNGDFSDGIAHWHGDGRSPADFSSDNPLQASDPFTAKGIIIPLKGTSWTRVQQDFRSTFSAGVFTVTYKVSPNLVFSDKPEDYQGIPALLGWGWKPFNGPPGNWMLDITGKDGTMGRHWTVKPKTGTNAEQTVKFKLSDLTPLDDETLTLAFPPGTGMVVVLSVSVSDH
jgi:hypothetical protein